jgi:hypothetical protein
MVPRVNFAPSRHGLVQYATQAAPCIPQALTAAANCCRPGMRAAGFAAENACIKASCDTSFSSAGPVSKQQVWHVQVQWGSTGGNSEVSATAGLTCSSAKPGLRCPSKLTWVHGASSGAWHTACGAMHRPGSGHTSRPPQAAVAADCHVPCKHHSVRPIVLIG